MHSLQSAFVSSPSPVGSVSYGWGAIHGSSEVSVDKKFSGITIYSKHVFNWWLVLKKLLTFQNLRGKGDQTETSPSKGDNK